RAERAADGTAEMRHGVLPNECCCEERCYPCSAEAPSETAPGCDAGVGRCPRGQGQRSAGRIGASLIKAEQKASERVTSSRAPASLRPLAAPSPRRAVPPVDHLPEYLGPVGGLVPRDLVQLLPP